MESLTHILKKFNLRYFVEHSKSPIEIPDFGRRQLTGLFTELGFKKGVEVGVASGWYSSLLMEANPDLELYGVDPYIPHRGYIDYTRPETFTKLEAEAHARLDQYPNYHFVRKLSMDALADFKDKSLDFVYLDGDHSYESVVADIAGWSKKIRPGGILAGHDFAHHKRPGVKIHVIEAVRGYTTSYSIHPWFILGREANDEGLIRDKIRSWMWVLQ